MPEDKIILSLGCNLGDRRLSLQRAREALGRQVLVERVSSIYETSPVDHRPERHQPPYYNLVLSGKTSLSPERLLRFIQGVEREIAAQAVAEGFPPCEKRDQGPRYLDIDIVFFGDLISDTPEFRVPHPAYSERLFVLVPLLEIEPEWRDPVSGEEVSIRLEKGDFSGQEITRVDDLGSYSPPFRGAR